MCNYKKCRKRLTNVAYVTACSHVFCDEDGTREFNKATTCPACETNLSAKFEIVRNNLQPSEQYKSMILAGLKPDVICEIASRALSFWMYQSHQEKTYQEYMATKAKERATQLEQYYEQIVARTNTELTNLKSQLTAAKKENEETRKKYHEVSDKLMERNRQHQKLQYMYDSMRRKFITMSSFESSGLTPNQAGSHRPTSIDSSGDAVGLDIRQDGDLPANYVQKKFSVNLGTPRS